MWQLNHERLSDAIQKGTGIDIAKTNFNSPKFELFANLTQDAATFSAFKNHEEQAKLFALLKGDDGKIRTFSQFKKVAMPLAEQYNINWLKTEHNAAINNSLMAKKWQGFQENADLYPNLEYRHSGNPNGRPEHIALDGLVLPMNDPRWRKIYPPNGWGCGCDVVQTDDPVNKVPGWDEMEPDKGFDFNPGIDQKLFSDNAGYYQTKGNKKLIDKEGRNLLAKQSRQFGKKYKGKTIKASGLGSVELSGKGFNHLMSQTHSELFKRNLALENLPSLLKGLKWEIEANKKPNPMVKQYHKAEVNIGGVKSLIKVREMQDGTFKLYSITEKK